MALEEYAPARPRSDVTTIMIARRADSCSVVSGWSTVAFEAAAVSARVSSSAYGLASFTRACALTIRDAEMSSMARVIFFVAWTDRIRRRRTRTCAGIASARRDLGAAAAHGPGRLADLVLGAHVTAYALAVDVAGTQGGDRLVLDQLLTRRGREL